MPYFLSATKLQNYHRCAKAYYFRYERGVSGPVSFGSASLGTALHQALATIYRDWQYQDALPQRDWIEFCWHQHYSKLNPTQREEGWQILCNYWERFVKTQTSLKRPLALEGKLCEIHKHPFNGKVLSRMKERPKKWNKKSRCVFSGCSCIKPARMLV